jgi:hypothetical protein
MNVKFIIIVLLSLQVCGILPTCAEEGAEVTEVSRWDNGALRETVVNDADRNITIRNFYNQDGTLERVEKYDSGGNKIEVSLYDANGDLREGVDGWAAKRWRYIDGKIFQETTYGTDGKPRDRRTFNEYGKLVARQYMTDGEADPDDVIRKEPAYGRQAVIVYGPKGKIERATTFVNE